MALSQPPAYPPRSKHLYSNRGAIIAGHVAEVATGVPYETLMRRKLFEPLAMKTPSFTPTRTGDLVGHDQGQPKVGLRPDNPPLYAPAGTARMTLGDFGRFALDPIKGPSGQGRVLKTQTYRFLQTAQEGSGFGIGWGVHAEVDGFPGPFVTHTGSIGYWFARIALEPSRDAGMIITANAVSPAVQSAVTGLETSVIGDWRQRAGPPLGVGSGGRVGVRPVRGLVAVPFERFGEAGQLLGAEFPGRAPRATLALESRPATCHFLSVTWQEDSWPSLSLTSKIRKLVEPSNCSVVVGPCIDMSAVGWRPTTFSGTVCRVLP